MVSAAHALLCPLEPWGQRWPGEAEGQAGRFGAVPGLPDSASQKAVALSDFSFAKHLCLPTNAGFCIYFRITGLSTPPPRPPPLSEPAVVGGSAAGGSMYIIKTGLGFVGRQSINQSGFNHQASDGRRDRHRLQRRLLLLGPPLWEKPR